MPQLGALVTDFTQIKAGALHRANGGYLLLDAQKVLTQPFAWEGLKRVLTTHTIRIESLGQMYSLVSTISLEPEPIPVNVKIVLFGERFWYHLLFALDPDFRELFKVAVDFDDEIPRTMDNQMLVARLIATITRRSAFLPFERGAVARLIEQRAREVEDRERLSTHMQDLVDLMTEADHAARKARSPGVDARHVDDAIEAQRRRAGRLREQVQETILRGTVLIDTAGERVGQVNGLSVYSLGNQTFAKPTRITAHARVGDGEVIDVQREVALGGPIHSKGVLILAAFLAARFSSDRPHSLRASLVFEQTYGEVEGDSASAAELCALLSLARRCAGATVVRGDRVGEPVRRAAVDRRGEPEDRGLFRHLQGARADRRAGGADPGIEREEPDAARRRVVGGRRSRAVPRARGAHDRRGASSFSPVCAPARRTSPGRFPDGTLNQRVAARLREFSFTRQAFAGIPVATKWRPGTDRKRR